MTNVLAGKLAPVIVIEVPTGPDTRPRAIEASGATVNGDESVPAPAVAAIVCAPAVDAAGTVMVAENVPVPVVVTVDGVVVTMAPSYLMVTAALAG